MFDVEYEIGDTISMTINFELPDLNEANQVEFEKVTEYQWKPLYRWDVDGEEHVITDEDSYVLFDAEFLSDDTIIELMTENEGFNDYSIEDEDNRTPKELMNLCI